MKIAFVHYHLKTGGVTTVLRRQIAAIQGACETLVLTGDRAANELPCKVVEIPGLGYDQPGAFPTAPDMVAERVLKALSEKWPGGCDVLHVHNPTLAKNRQFLQIIKRLQQSGVNLFLQIHDFAEDGRPHVYFEEEYPENCHYGVINTRDAKSLLAAGLSPQASTTSLTPSTVFLFAQADARNRRFSTRSAPFGARTWVRPSCYPCFSNMGNVWPLPSHRTARPMQPAIGTGSIG
jgi:hypothetical protein